MLYHPGKIASFSRLTLERGIAAVVVGFPATHLLTARARICISASHTRKDLDCALKVQQTAKSSAVHAHQAKHPGVRTGRCPRILPKAW